MIESQLHETSSDLENSFKLRDIQMSLRDEAQLLSNKVHQGQKEEAESLAASILRKLKQMNDS